MMGRLPRHPVPPDHKLHQHTRLPPPRPLMDRSEATRMPESPQPGRSVAKEPELLSPSYRNHVRKLSPRNQNRGVKHLPGSHNDGRKPRSRLVSLWIMKKEARRPL